MLAMVAVILIPVGVAIDRGVTQFYYQQNTREMLAFGQRLADFIERAPAPGAAEAVRSIAQLAGTPIMLIDTDARVSAGSGQLAAEVGRRVQSEQAQNALKGDASVVLAVDETLPGSLFVAAVPVGRGDRAIGAVLLFRSADEVSATLTRMRALLGFGGGSFLLLVWVVGWLLSRRIVRPILQMKETADRMASGDYSTRVSGSGNDELTELANAINRLGESLHSLAAGRRAFFANVSHELRTPLSYVRGYSDALAHGLFESEEEVRETGRILSEESKRLSRLVDDLFDLAQAEEGRLRLEVERLNASDAIEEIVVRMQSVAEQKGIRLQAEASEALWLEADPLRFEQIMVNFLDNALRHTPEGGRVQVSGLREPGGRVTVTVEDSGPGLGAEPHRVWERFYRGDESRNRNLGGSGLGLAIVKSLVELHGGDVFADNRSTYGGARFGFVLPSIDG